MKRIFATHRPPNSAGSAIPVSRGLRRARAAAALLALAIAGAMPARLTADTRAVAEPPDLVLQIEIDPASGVFTASALLSGPRGDVTLPDADWLQIDTLRIGGRDRPLDIGGTSILPDRLHRNRDLSLHVSGRLPAPDGNLSAASAASEASYLLGPAWFPVDAAGIRGIDLRVSLPEGQRVAATGSLVSENGTETRFTFRGFPEDLGVFVGPYVVTEEIRDGRRLRTYFEAENPDLSQRYLDAVAGYIARYETNVGDYPHDGFSVVSTPLPVGLGFAGLTYVSRDILGHPYMTGRSLAHEVLHTWWGNAVGIDFDTGNWAEGLTTFQADYALAEDAGAEAARAMRIGWIRDLARLDAGAARPLVAFRTSAGSGDQSEGYGKAAFVFHMLRDELGSDTFAAGIRRFYADQRGRIAGWPDMRASFETVSGRDLGWFFDQWTGRPGLPDVALGLEDASETAEGRFEVTLIFEQSDPAYRLRMPVVFETPEGPVRRAVRIDGPETRTTLRLDARPLSVRLDPGFDVARRPRAGELTPILQDARGVESIAAVLASPGAATETSVAEALAPLTGSAELIWQENIDESGARPVLIAGHEADVAAMRPAHLGALPQIGGEGDTRLWIERDGAGRRWLFLTFDDAAELAEDLRNAPFYGGQSHLTADAGRITGQGIWPETSNRSALRIGIAEGPRPGP